MHVRTGWLVFVEVLLGAADAPAEAVARFEPEVTLTITAQAAASPVGAGVRAHLRRAGLPER